MIINVKRRVNHLGNDSKDVYTAIPNANDQNINQMKTLKEYRELAGLSQEEIANKCGIIVERYQQYEMNPKYLENAPFNIGTKIFYYLNIDAQKYFGLKE